MEDVTNWFESAADSIMGLITAFKPSDVGMFY